MHDLKINLTSPTNAWHDSEDLQFKWLKNQNESWVWTILLVDSFFTDFLCRMYILWWQCLLWLYIQYQFFSSCMFDLMNVILDFWYNSLMERKIFNSLESRNKFDLNFEPYHWWLRSTPKLLYLDYFGRYFVGNIYFPVSSNHYSIIRRCHISCYRGVSPICAI